MNLRSAAVAFALALLSTSIVPALADDTPSPDAGVSKIRIVRLSEAKGIVAMDRAIGRGFEPAIPNMPIVETGRVRTEQGVAEVEFEDNSSLRLAPNTVIEFPTLERAASGATISAVRLVQGTAYVSLVKGKPNQFSLLFGTQKLALEPGAHVRLDLDQSQAHLAVLDGSVEINGASGPENISRKKTVTFHLADQTQSVEKQVAEQPFDSWDHDATGYHARTASYSALSSSPYSYGLNDLAYYGNFVDAGGCGMMWRPYFASAAWDPYSNGVWAYYQGAGYSWVSPYPWGWMPYHYGTWSFCQGTGWGWMPGGMWNGLGNAGVLMAASGKGGLTRFQPPPHQAPRPGESTLALVSLRPLVRSEAASPESFVFRKDSAGMGIPRNELGKLDRFSRQAVQHGSSNTHIFMTAPAMSSNMARPTPGHIGPVSMHRGYAPSSAASAGPMMSGAPRSSSGGAAPVSRGATMSAGPSMSRGSGGPAPSSGGHPR